MMTTSNHEPTPEFERYLEWQVMTAMRRRDRFADPPGRDYRSYLGVAVIVVASMLVGAGGVVVSARIQVNQQKQSLLAQQQGEMQLAEMQVELAQKAVEEAKRRVETGMTGPDALASADRDLLSANLKLQRIRLNLDEVGRSGRPVQDDLTSPVVDGRDFVAERLELDLKAAGTMAEAAERKLKSTRTRQEIGVATYLELLETSSEAARAAREMRLVQQKLDLRRRFLAGGVTAEETTRQRLVLATRVELEAAQSAFEVASKRYEWVRNRSEIGAVGEIDVLKAQLEMLTRKQDLTNLQARLRTLQGGL